MDIYVILWFIFGIIGHCLFAKAADKLGTDTPPYWSSCLILGGPILLLIFIITAITDSVS